MRRVATLTATVSLLLAAREALLQRHESEWIRQTALRIVTDAHATGRRDQVIALRDYLREHVTWRGAPSTEDDRPFFRATAQETIESGLGYCGEDSRAFINLADTLGIPAARINLYGAKPHVVAEADLGSQGGRVIVDAQNPPQIAELESLDQVMVRHGYDDFSTLNLRRLRVAWLFSRTKLTIGPITFWGENPHAMKAALWFLFATALVVPRWSRAALRRFLLRRGWVHVSSLSTAQRASMVAKSSST